MSATTDWLQVGLLAANAGFIYRYLLATQQIAKTAREQVEMSQQQVEASFRPAIVAFASNESTEAGVFLENIGNGPAVAINWRVPNSRWSDKVSYLEPHKPLELKIGGVRTLYEAGVANPESGTAIVECFFRSLSGTLYTSTSTYRFEDGKFVSTDFTDPW